MPRLDGALSHVMETTFSPVSWTSRMMLSMSLVSNFCSHPYSIGCFHFENKPLAKTTSMFLWGPKILSSAGSKAKVRIEAYSYFPAQYWLKSFHLVQNESVQCILLVTHVLCVGVGSSLMLCCTGMPTHSKRRKTQKHISIESRNLLRYLRFKKLDSSWSCLHWVESL